MDDAEERSAGTIYRADANGVSRVIYDICIPNGPAIGPDGTSSDTPILARIDPQDGHRDDATIDAEGCL